MSQLRKTALLGTATLLIASLILVLGIRGKARPSAPEPVSAVRVSTFSVEVPWRRSNCENALAVRAGRRRASYDPGITPGFIPLPECRQCDGIGGHPGPTPDDPENGDDMTTCEYCDGTGIVSPH